jgi:hypothetical protein
MVGRLIQSAVNFVVLIGLTLLLPLFCMAAWLWGSKDEQWLMKVLFCVLSPFCACLWYILLSHLVLARRSSYLIQFLVFIGTTVLVILILNAGVVSL